MSPLLLITHFCFTSSEKYPSPFRSTRAFSSAMVWLGAYLAFPLPLRLTLTQSLSLSISLTVCQLVENLIHYPIQPLSTHAHMKKGEEWHKGSLRRYTVPESRFQCNGVFLFWW